MLPFSRPSSRAVKCQQHVKQGFVWMLSNLFLYEDKEVANEEGRGQ